MDEVGAEDDSMPLTRRERLRRVTLLCCHFIRNLAYYRVAHRGEPRSPNRDFWVTVDGNFRIRACLSGASCSAMSARSTTG